MGKIQDCQILNLTIIEIQDLLDGLSNLFLNTLFEIAEMSVNAQLRVL